MPRKPMPILADDIYKIRQPATCRLSPDGKNLAVVVGQPDKESLKNLSHIWMVPTGDGAPRQFTQGKGGDSQPRFSPDGRTLAFLSARSGKSEIWTMPTDGGEARQLTKLGGSIAEFSFSPNGRKIAITFVPQDADAKEREEKKKRGEPGADSPRVRAITRLFYKLDGVGFLPQGRKHIWIVDVETGKAKQLTSDDRYDEHAPTWSPDGRWIYFNSNRTANPDFDLERTFIWRVRARGGEIERVRTFDGPSTTFSLSPDGAWIAFLGYDDADAPWNTRHTKVWLVPSEGGRPVELAADLDRGCENSTINDTFGTGLDRAARLVARQPVGLLRRQQRGEHGALDEPHPPAQALARHRTTRGDHRLLHRLREPDRLRVLLRHEHARGGPRLRRSGSVRENPDELQPVAGGEDGPPARGALVRGEGPPPAPGLGPARTEARRLQGPGGPLHPRRPCDAVRPRVLPRIPVPGRQGILRLLLESARRHGVHAETPRGHLRCVGHGRLRGPDAVHR